MAFTIEHLTEFATDGSDVTFTLSEFSDAPVSGDRIILFAVSGQHSTVPSNQDATYTWTSDFSNGTTRGTHLATIVERTVVGGSNPATITVQQNGNGTVARLIATLIKISGADNSGDAYIDTDEFTDERNNPNPDHGSVDVEDGAAVFLLDGLAGVSSDPITFIPPTGYTLLSGTQVTFEAAQEIAYKLIVTGTTEDPGAWASTGIAGGAESHWYTLVVPLAAESGGEDGEADWTGLGAYSADGEVVIEAEAEVEGDGAWEAAGQIAAYGEASVDGVGSWVADGEEVAEATTSVDGIGTWEATGEEVAEAEASVDGVGSWTAVAQSGENDGEATLAGLGVFAAAGEIVGEGEAGWDATGTYGAAAVAIVESGGEVAGEGGWGGSALVAQEGEAEVAGDGAWETTAEAIAAATAELEGDGLWEATGEYAPGPVSADWEGQGSFTASGQSTCSAEATVEGQGEWEATGSTDGDDDGDRIACRTRCICSKRCRV